MLVAASCKFTEIGELAPWCKLILLVEELTEFKAENLNLPYAVAKAIATHCAASCKFTEIGELAPWCKLILPVEELTEFKAENLNLPYAVAKAIATHCGNSSNKNIQGTPEEAFLKDKVPRIDRIQS
ncbi:hypothetical protein J6590_043581 [Homalodisca vitripennis]|nr:hypothetical protein J6590_043581 [Homalodisca vitripennis]